MIGGHAPSLINFHQHLLQEIQQRGYEIHAIGSDDKQTANRLRTMGVHFHSVPINRHSISPLNDFFYFMRLYTKIRKINPDLCLAYTIKPVIYGLLAARLVGVKEKYSLIIGLGYAFIAKGVKGSFVKMVACILYTLAFRLSKRVIFLNEDDKDYFCHLKLISKGKSVVVNGSGVDLTYFIPSPFPKKLAFLMIARFLPEKGIFEYLEACKRLKAEFPSVRGCLVGFIDNASAGVTKKTIQSWEAFGIENLGKLEDVRPALREASVLVLPSYREGIPCSVLEAMAMGRPIITTDTPGCRQTVEEGKNGFLVPIKNSEALYQAMLKFVNDPALISSMGEASLALVREKFDVRKVNEVMLDIMDLKEC